MIKFIHTADIHFGMENYGKIDPHTGIHSRLLDFNAALNACIDKAIAEEVDLFLFSGDAYKTAHPSPTQQRLLFQCLLRLFNAKIPVVLIIGNHDNPLSFGKANALDLFGQLPIGGFYVIAKPTSFVLETKSGPVQIIGIPWPSRTTLAINNAYAHATAQELTQYISQAVASLIQQFTAALNPELPTILAGHLTVSSGIFSGSEKRAIYGTDPVLLPSQLALHPIDYVALGHLHRYQNLNEGGHPAVVYSGSIERVDFGERKENKGFCLVTIHDKQNTTHEFIQSPMRPFIQIDVKLDDKQTQTDQILEALKKYTLTNAVVKIVYHIPADKKDRVDIPLIQQACEDAHYLVGIFPVREITTKERRLQLKVDMSLEHLLDTYFASKPEYAHNRPALVKRALELNAEACCDEELL